MDKINIYIHDLNMASNLKAARWITARTLHQIQILSCDLCDFTRWELSDECAPFWRLYRHDKSGAEVNVAGKTIPILPGHITLVPPNTRFSSRLRNPVRQLFMHFLVEPRFPMHTDAVFQFAANGAVADCCDEIVRLLEVDAAGMRVSLLGQILVSMALLELPEQKWSPRFEDSRITDAVESIGRAYPAKVGNEALACAANMHPSAFIRLFRQCTGRTPLDYLMDMRLEEACTMLHFDDASLDEIAEKTGFGERGYFTRVFSRKMNCPPARYRRLVNVSNRLRPSG